MSKMLKSTIAFPDEPVVLRKAHSLSEDYLYETFATACMNARARGDCPNIKMAFDGAVVLSLSDSQIPASTDVSFSTYMSRLLEERSAKELTVYAFGLQEASESLRNASRELAFQLLPKLDLGSVNLIAELFAGRYSSTPNGIHTESCANIQLVVRGRKTIWVWPPDRWQIGTTDIEVKYDQPTGDTEQYLRDQADWSTTPGVRLDGDPGDAIYWPPLWWHVGTSPEETIALTVALYPIAC
jgi:hypothetical protein